MRIKKDEVTDLHKTLQKIIFYWNWSEAIKKSKSESQNLQKVVINLEILGYIVVDV